MHPAAAGMLAPIPGILILAICLWFQPEREVSSGAFGAAYPIALAVAMPLGAFAGLLLHRIAIWGDFRSYLACAAIGSALAPVAGFLVFRGASIEGAFLTMAWGAMSGIVFRGLVHVPGKNAT